MWKKLLCRRKDIQLVYSLCGGQCFRWKKTGEEEWTGVFSNCVWILSQSDECILYKVYPSTDIDSSSVVEGKSKSKKKKKLDEVVDADSKYGEMLSRYLRLDVNLDDYYEKWSASDPHFREAAVKFNGVRILMQDPVENLFSFICSANNHISRISSMVEKLCTFYGTKIGEVNGVAYHSFPPVSALTGPAVEQALRTAGFGYRAKYIHQSACKITEMGGLDWLERLKQMPYDESKAALMTLPGIGAKVADCICLMSLCHLEAIPVDTHIFQVSVQKYLPHLKGTKSVTKQVYNEIGDHFRGLYGSYAGWAHTIIFCAELKMFQEKVPSSPKRKLKNSKANAKKVKK